MARAREVYVIFIFSFFLFQFSSQSLDLITLAGVLVTLRGHLSRPGRQRFHSDQPQPGRSTWPFGPAVGSNLIVTIDFYQNQPSHSLLPSVSR